MRHGWLLGALAAGLVLSACSTPPFTDGSAPPAGQLDSERGQVWPESWDDVVGGETHEELIEQARAELREFAKDHPMAEGVELDIQLIRVVDPDEYGDTQVNCLAEAGFAATGYSDGTVLYDEVPQDQGLALNYAVYQCQMQYLLTPYAHLPLPRKPAVRLYEHWVSSSADCVRSEGFEVETPPTLNTWLDTLMGQQTYEWTPYASVDLNPDPTLRDAVYRSCPPRPADFYSD